MSKPKIVFMGTPGFSVPSLEILTRNNYPLAAVVTQPDRPKGRGRHTVSSAVKTCAQSHRLTILQPEQVRNSEFIEHLRTLCPDIIVVAAFGQILPREIIELAPKGCVNVHPSLLPKYRGAAPVNWTIIRGETKTGVTIMLMDEGMDTGDILAQEETLLAPEETSGELHDRLAGMGADLLIKSIEMIATDTITRTPQDPSLATYAPRLKKEDGLIRWDSEVHHIVNLIRGLSPVPGAYSLFKGKMLKIFSATGEEALMKDMPGTVARETEKGLPVAAKNGYIYLQEVQMENKKRMPVHDFLRGFRLSRGDILR
jgi:methionyl-tRNA formyltransferase